ncbi:MAG: branched-chain amino acid ABC transporter permease [Candidatus Caldatribacteriota bacterium]|nr:branched-chain amino acid ABC transporter permease [Atribacterota bacterium]MDD3031792.1 branched-chain amino acid ABC transporter permease [Atribacterota bacterium]MDD3640355.1 branched-chain amino acid ABC transporter permease [Atribacterota bacterium]MDD4288042.1 branched-chain amino acid ABC transporter permease [Atribacterota bacterium]MDD4764455.1 branched-chain amino acid ABC transporter permease [Atribacterota bacterium]
MKLIIEQLLNGLTIGSFYALIALGYSMVYGVMKLINFAHGDLFTLGSYFGYTLLVMSTAYVTSTFGLWGGLIAAMLVAAIGTGIMGIIVERLAYRPIYPTGRLPAVVSALGVSIFLQNAIMVIWGARPQAYTSNVIPNHILNIGGLRINVLQIIILLLSFLLMGILYYIIQRTTFGAAIRACALDRETAALMGININLIIFFIFALGPALGGTAGVMVGVYYRRISFIMGWNYGLKAFTATILGGIGNIPGAMIGGLILGLLEMLGSTYLSTAYKDVFVFLVLILVLIFRPRGILGEKVAEKV